MDVSLEVLGHARPGASQGQEEDTCAKEDLDHQRIFTAFGLGLGSWVWQVERSTTTSFEVQVSLHAKLMLIVNTTLAHSRYSTVTFPQPWKL